VLDDNQDKAAVERRLIALQDVIKASAELIDEQVMLVKSLGHSGQAAVDADQTLELMMDLQVAHVMYADLLSDALLRSPR
jgi:hypothetical protein